MSPYHSYRGLLVSFMALVAFAFTAALSSFRPRHEPPPQQPGEGLNALHALRERTGAPARLVSGPALPVRRQHAG
jgi:hypothetical protein